MDTILNGERIVYNDKGNVEQIVFVWSRGALQDTAKKMGYDLTDEQLDDAMTLTLSSHDCSLGITWDFIEAIIEEVVI